MPFDAGVGFAFSGKDAGLSKTARGAAASIDTIGSSVDGLGQKFQANLDNVQSFFKELSQKQLERVESGLQSIADSASVNQTSLEGMAASAAKAAKPIVASLGLTGDAAKKAKGQIVGLSIGMNVGAEVVGKAVKALTLYRDEFEAVGLKSTKDVVKFGEVAGIEMDKFGSQIADLGRSWNLSKQQLGELIPWIVEAGRSFGFGKEAVAGLGDVTKALDVNLSKVLLKDGPQAIMKFTKGIYGLALVSSKSLGMDFPDALSQSIEVFNKLAGDVGTFQKTFTGLSTDFGPLAEKLGLAIGDWDAAFKLVQQDPMEFVKQLRILMDNMDMGDQKSQFFLQRLKLTLGEDSSMIRFLTDQSVDMDKALGQLEGVKAGTDSLQKFGKEGFTTGFTMADVLDRMRQKAKMSFMAISKDMWRPYMKSLRAGYKSTVSMMKRLSSDTEPGGVGTLIKAASMALRFGPGGAIRALFPSKEGTAAAGMLDALSDSVVDFLPHLTALGALGFRPGMLAAPFKMALSPLKMLGGPLVAFSGMLGGLPKLALSIFGPLGILAVAIGGFTLLSRKWKGKQESSIEKFFKTELPIMLLRGLSYLLTGKDLEKGERKALSKLAGPELWGSVASQGMEAFGKALKTGMEAMEIGTDVMVTLATKLAEGITNALAKADYEQFGESLAKIVVNLTSAIGKVVAKTPDLVIGLAKGIASALGQIKWGKMFGGMEKEVAGATEPVGEMMKAGFGLENILGAGALIGVPLVLRKMKKIRKEGTSILGGLKKGATKAPAGVLAGIPECIPTCGMGVGGMAGGVAAPAKMLPGAISGPGAVMAVQPSKWARMTGAVKGAAGKAAGWKGLMGMGALGGVAPGLVAGGAAAAGADIGALGSLAAVGAGAAMGGLPGAAIAASMVAAGGSVKTFNETFSKGMDRMEKDADKSAGKVEMTLGSAIAAAWGGVDVLFGGLGTKFTEAIVEALSGREIKLTTSRAAEILAIGVEEFFFRIKISAKLTWEYFKVALKNVIDGTKQMATAGYNLVVSLGQYLVAWWQEKLPLVWTIATKAVEGFKWLWDTGKKVISWIGSAFEKLYYGIGDIVVKVGAKIKYFMEYGKMIAMNAMVFFKQIYYGIHDMIDGLVIESMTLFKDVVEAFWAPFKALPQGVLDAMKKVKGFENFVTFLETTSDKITDAVSTRLKETMLAAAARKQELLKMGVDLIMQEGKVSEAQAKADNATLSKAEEKKAAVKANWQEFLTGLKKAGDGISMLQKAQVAGGPGGVFGFMMMGALAPPEMVEEFYKKQGVEGTEAILAEQKKVLGQYKAIRESWREDIVALNEEAAANLASQAAEASAATFATLIADPKALGLTKKQLKGIEGIAKEAMTGISQAGTAEQVAIIIEKAAGQVKGPKKIALLQLLTASAGVLFAGGAVPEAVGKTKAEIMESGAALAAALVEKQAAILEEMPTPKGGKAKTAKEAKIKAAKETAATLKEITAAPVGPAGYTVGGKTFAAPPPPAITIKGPGGVTQVGGGWGGGPVAINLNVQYPPYMQVTPLYKGGPPLEHSLVS